MATTPRDRLERQRGLVEKAADQGDLTTEAAERLLEFSRAVDPAIAEAKFRDEDGPVTLQPRSNQGYLSVLRICAEAGLDLCDCTVDDLNELLIEMHDEEGKSKSTLATYQAAAQRFYGYHDDLGIEPAAIRTFTPEQNPRHDEMDMFTDEEVAALRQAVSETRNPVRNRAFLELLIFTGQRLTALLTLRLKDVELDTDDGGSYIYLNDDYAAEHGGLKGALARGRKRPIFGAAKFVRDWMEYHPHGEPDDWLFVGDPSHWKTDPDDHWSEPSAAQRLQQIADVAGVDKPVNAHNFRHYCATVLYRDYDLDREAIRMLLGHVEGSKALEETYTHLFEADHIERAEAALGIRDRDTSTPLTPDLCPTCGQLLEDGWTSCPSCQEVFGPAADVADAADDAERETGRFALDPDMSEEDRAALRTIAEHIDDPTALASELETVE